MLGIYCFFAFAIKLERVEDTRDVYSQDMVFGMVSCARNCQHTHKESRHVDARLVPWSFLGMPIRWIGMWERYVIDNYETDICRH